QVGEHSVQLIDADALVAQAWRQIQIFVHTQSGENAALLRAVTQHAHASNLVSGLMDHFASTNTDAAAAAINEPENGLERGGAPGAITTQQRHDLAFV